MIRRLIGTAGVGLLALALGCAGASVKTFSKPGSAQRQYGKVKKVAVLPFDSVVEGAQAPRLVLDLFLQELLTRGTFDTVEEPRYVLELMKKLKLRNTENLDREIVRKIGEELKAQALILGNVLLFGVEESSEVAEFACQVTMIDVESGEILWAGRSMASSSTTVGEILGVNKGPSVNDVATRGVIHLVGRFDREYRRAREEEVERMLDVAKAQEAEKAVPSEKVEAPAKPAEEKAEEILLQVKPK